MPEPLITRYRPAAFDEMIGHEAMRASLTRVLESDSAPHAFLMTGPGGIGKTTSARIIATMLQCEILEISAAEYSGTDDMRNVIETGHHMALGGSGRRMIIIDECHGLSKAAWQVLLKLLEEPPEHLYLALCTTEVSKVPDTIQQRCFHVLLKPLSVREIEELLLLVCELEGWQVNPDVMTAVIQAALGSPRKALTLLQKVWDAPSIDEARRIIDIFDQSEPFNDLCKALVMTGGAPWPKLQPLLERIDDEEWEKAHIQVGRFLAACMKNAKKADEAQRYWSMLDAFTFPVETYDKKVAFYAALGKILWGASQ
jgi:DNA polymerase III gamma/tau subunit